MADERKADLLESAVEVVRGRGDAEGMWYIHVNGKYIHRELYAGDAYGIASRLCAALAASTTGKGGTDG